LLDEDAFSEIQSFGALCLVFKDVVGKSDEYPEFEYYRIGFTESIGEGISYRWICAYFEGVQYTSFLVDKESEAGRRAYFAINIEHKNVQRRVYRKIKKYGKLF